MENTEIEWVVKASNKGGGEEAKVNGKVMGWVAWDRDAKKWACAYDGKIGVVYFDWYDDAKQRVIDYLLHGPNE